LLPGDETIEYFSEDEGIDAAFDEDTPAADFEQEDDGEDDTRLNGMGEYGFGFWSRWSRTSPRYLFPKAPWHSLARFTVNRKHGDINLRDRTLAVWVGAGFYHFATYSLPDTSNLAKNLPYDDALEGWWNYLYFGYSKSEQRARGFLYFSSTDQVKDIEIEADHDYIDDYFHFTMRKEFSYPFFNGLISQVHLKVGKGGYVRHHSGVTEIAKASILPARATFFATRQTQVFIKEKAKVE
jgi:hypothetical protein